MELRSRDMSVLVVARWVFPHQQDKILPALPRPQRETTIAVLALHGPVALEDIAPTFLSAPSGHAAQQSKDYRKTKF